MTAPGPNWRIVFVDFSRVTADPGFAPDCENLWITFELPDWRTAW